MITKPRTGDYFLYFPDTPELEHWGIWIAASGIGTAAPRTAYPPDTHPGDHHFKWEHGRVLDALQIILITEGSGWVETSGHDCKRIGAGTAFLLPPGVWHRYRPDPLTGWRESWIEIRGRVIGDLLGSGGIPRHPVITGRNRVALLEEIMETIHGKVASGASLHRPELSAEALKAVALLSRNDGEGSGDPLRTAVIRAERYLSEHHAESLDMQDLARMLGVSYSSFRRCFRHEIGLSPWQYLLTTRLNRAQRLLASGNAKLDEIADAVGFSSGFHLSAAFKKARGISPAIWRKQRRRAQSQE